MLSKKHVDGLAERYVNQLPLNIACFILCNVIIDWMVLASIPMALFVALYMVFWLIIWETVGYFLSIAVRWIADKIGSGVIYGD